jgi:hypothetical protein
MEASGPFHYSSGFRDNGGLGTFSVLTKIKRQWRRGFFITHHDLETMETLGLFHYSTGFRDNGGLGALSLLTRI